MLENFSSLIKENILDDRQKESDKQKLEEKDFLCKFLLILFT
jgi:hypothetical protein